MSRLRTPRTTDTAPADPLERALRASLGHLPPGPGQRWLRALLRRGEAAHGPAGRDERRQAGGGGRG